MEVTEKPKKRKKRITFVGEKFTEDNPKHYQKVLYPENVHNILLTLKQQNKTHYNEVIYRILLIGLKNYTLDEAIDIIDERDSIIDNFFKEDEKKQEELTREQVVQENRKKLATRLWAVNR